ncbi:MAG: hypothetical protein HDT47_04095 [Ruminococcaceae bacterium]|nr:hypothetical protein [Oscillospiraceae bacterium]
MKKIAPIPSKKKKKKSRLKSGVFFIYWILTTIIYFILTFLLEDYQSYTGDWHDYKAWIVWVVAGLLFPVVMIVCNLIEDKKNMDKENK